MHNNLISPNASPTEAAFAGGFAGGVFGSVLIFLCVFSILQIIAWWKIFEKAGEKGWKALIPIYDIYIYYKIVGMKGWFWGLLGLSVIAGIVAGATGLNLDDFSKNTLTGANLVGFIVYVVTAIIGFIIQIVQSVRISKAFGHGVGFTLGLIFFGPLFQLILGFGSSKYDKKVVKAWTN